MPKRYATEGEAMKVLELRSLCMKVEDIAAELDLPKALVNRVCRQGEGWLSPHRAYGLGLLKERTYKMLCKAQGVKPHERRSKQVGNAEATAKSV